MRDQRAQTGDNTEDKSSPLRTTVVLAVPTARLTQQQGISHPALSLPSLSPDESNTYANTNDEESQTLESGRYTLDTFTLTLNTADIDGDPTFDTIGDDTTTTVLPAHEAVHAQTSTSAAAGALFPSGAATLVIMNEQDVLREKRLCLASSFLFFVGTLLSFSYCWLKNTHGLPLYPELVLDLLLCLAYTAMMGHVVFFEFASLDGGFQCDKHLQTRRSLDHMRYAQTVPGKRPFSREIRVVNMAQSVLFLLATFVQAVALISVNSYYHQEQELQLQQQLQSLAAQSNNTSGGYHGYFYYHNYNSFVGQAAANYNAENAVMESEERDRLMGQYNWLTFVSSLLYFFSAATVLVVHAVRTLFDRVRASSRNGSASRQLLNHVGKQPPKKLPAKIIVTPTLLADIAERRYSTILKLDHAANALYLFLTTAMLIISISALSLEDPDVRFLGDLNLLEILAFLWVWIGALYFVADLLRWSYTPPRSSAAVAADDEADDGTNPTNGPPPPFKAPPSTSSRKRPIHDSSRKDDDAATATPPLYNAKSLPFPTSPQYIPAIEVELDVRSLPPCRGRPKTPRPTNTTKNNYSSDKYRYIPAIEVELDVRSLPSSRGRPKTKRKKDRGDQSQGSIPSSANNDNDVSSNNNNNDNSNLVNRIDNDAVIEDAAANNSSTANSDDLKFYRSSRDPDGVLQAEISNNTTTNKESKDPPSSMLIASESLIENKPSHVLATATSLYTTFSNNRNSRGDFNPGDHDATGRDASDPIQIQYFAMCDYGDDSEAVQDADNEDGIITLKRGSLSMDTICSAPPSSPPISSLTTTLTLYNNNNKNEYVSIDYVEMRDSNSPTRSRMANTAIAHGVDSVDDVGNNGIRRSENPLERFTDASALRDSPESVSSPRNTTSVAAVAHRLEASAQSDTKINNSDGNDDNDDDNDKGHYDYNRMGYVASLRQDYFALPGHHQEQSEQDQDKSTTSCSILRKTPSPSLDGIEIIQVDGARKHSQLRWNSPSSLGVSSTNAIAGSSSASTGSGKASFGRPPRKQQQSLSASSSSSSQSQQHHQELNYVADKNSDVNNNSPLTPKEQQQEQHVVQASFGRPPRKRQQSSSSSSSSQSQQHHQELNYVADKNSDVNNSPQPQQEQQQEQYVVQHETIDLTTAIEERDDGSLAYDPNNNNSNNNNKNNQKMSSPVRRASPPSYAKQPTPFSWTSIADRKYQQAQKRNQRRNNNNNNNAAASPGRFEDLEYFIDQF